MKSNKYKLQTVLDVRERAQAEAGKSLAARREVLVQAEAVMQRCVAAVDECRRAQRAAHDEMWNNLRDGSVARNVNLRRTHLTDLRLRETQLQAAVEKQRAVVERAETEVEQALARLAEALKELQVIVKHRDGWQVEQRRADGRREQKSSDEIGAIIHRRNSNKAS